jgi:hypothetical protein
MHKKLLAALAATMVMSACTDPMLTMGSVAIEKRRQMNDAQARLTSAAMCDVSIGAYYRELSEAERALTALVCGGVFPTVNVPLTALSVPSRVAVPAPAAGTPVD